MKEKSIEKLLRDKRKSFEKKKTWKERIIENFGRNPLLCVKCTTEKILWRIWHKDYGVIYDIRESRDMEEILYEPISRAPLQRKVVQISMFEV
ncbi:hypothetical protein HZR23_00960 [Serpentinicella alkaliphila]|uniref:hypothetical protein n=1 Tax=Serpentinicella alkaliphila TaxID=1734049 RepID=UPI001BC84923|nr:hypothetical protein [Serpentinicella alkaliphila]QUH24506.1 hypothetical protein HZR23_00960 [Serpentinicella alkaliphila]